MSLLGLELGATEFLILLLTAASLIFYLLRSRRPENFPPGPSRFPIIGNMHQLSSEPHKTFMEMRETFGNVFSFYFGSVPAVVLNDPKSIREAFAEPVFSGRANFLKPLLERSGGAPRGIIFTHSKVWTEQRRFVLKSLRDFGFGKKSMESMVLDEVNELIVMFKKSTGKPIQTQNKFNAAVLNSLWTLVAGNRYMHDDPMLQDLIKLLTSSISASRAAGAILFFPFLYKIRKWAPWMFGAGAKDRKQFQLKTMAFFNQTIEEHKDTFQPDAVPRDLIDTYLAEMQKAPPGSSFSGEEGLKNLKTTMLDLFVAGAETTSTTLTWMFLLLALNPEPQEKFHEEIKKVVGTSRLPSLNDRPNMPYTEALITEVMRYSAIVPTGVFHTVLEDTKLNGFDIPKNTIIISNLYCCMKDPKIWGDPEKFRPERFLSPDGKTFLRNEAFLPFSIGKRVCLGESLARDELFLFASSLFQRFRVTTDPNGPKLTCDYHAAAILIPKPHDLVMFDRIE